MGIETAIAIGITAAATAVSAQQAHAQQVHAKNDARAQQSRLLQSQQDAQAQLDAAKAAKVQRAQQLSMAGGGYDSTIQTSPLGLSGGTTGKTQLGA